MIYKKHLNRFRSRILKQVQDDIIAGYKRSKFDLKITVFLHDRCGDKSRKNFKILGKAIDFFLGGEYYYQEANKSFLKEVIFMEV